MSCVLPYQKANSEAISHHWTLVANVLKEAWTSSNVVNWQAQQMAATLISRRSVLNVLNISSRLWLWRYDELWRASNDRQWKLHLKRRNSDSRPINCIEAAVCCDLRPNKSLRRLFMPKNLNSWSHETAEWGDSFWNAYLSWGIKLTNE